MKEKKHCLNCGERITGLYCANCGQSADTQPRLNWKSLYYLFIDTFIGANILGDKKNQPTSRMGLLSTWWAVMRHPRQSIYNYLRGSRIRYANPFTLLALLSTIYVIVYYDICNAEVYTSSEGVREYGIVIYSMAVVDDFISNSTIFFVLLWAMFMAPAIKKTFRKFREMSFVEALYVAVFLSVCLSTLMLIFIPVKLYVSEKLEGYAVLIIYCLYCIVVFKRLFGLNKWQLLKYSFYVGLRTFVNLFLSLLTATILAISSLIYIEINGGGETVKDFDERVMESGKKSTPAATPPELTQGSSVTDEK